MVCSNNDHALFIDPNVIDNLQEKLCVKNFMFYGRHVKFKEKLKMIWIIIKM